jgi:acetyl esterase/lipase/GH43 family beta-xylosidase
MVIVFISFKVKAQQVVPLYAGNIPGSYPSSNLAYTDQNGTVFKNSVPELIIYEPLKETSNKSAVIICPGGGYGALVMGHEGYPVAEQLVKHGITCFILKYRLPDATIMQNPSIGPLQDLQQAIKLTRENAKIWNIDPDKIGVMGFSAGGHLAALSETHFSTSYIENKRNTSLRPDFALLIYPVISMHDSLAHQGSKLNLLGKAPDKEKVVEFSNEDKVNSQTPPTFLMHAADDSLVSVENSLTFYQALIKHGVSAGLHVFPVGGHGFPIEPAKSNWLKYCVNWLSENGWLDKPAKTITYKNPIKTEPLRDPQIIFSNGTYYMTGTSLLDGSLTSIGPGVKLFSSKNLTDWKFEKILVKPGSWYQHRIWAPEIHYINHKYYLTLNAFAFNPVSQGVCVAVADRIDGDYKVLTPDKPLCDGNDSHLFQDDDGRVYLFNSDNGDIPLHDNIVCRQISLDPLQIIKQKKIAIMPGTKNDWDGSPAENVAIEAPYVIKHNGTYYLFYSSWGRGYEVGYATSKNIYGPWKKYKQNPVYGAQSREIAKAHNKVYSQAADVPFTEVGHGNLFQTNDGQWWLSCHEITNSSAPQLMIDPVDFDSKGNVKIKLTWTTQTVPLKNLVE